MAKKIVFQTEINEQGFRTGLARTEALAKESDRRMALTKKTYGPLPTIGPGGTVTGSSGSKMSNFSSASSMFVSVARDSAASLASGAPIAQVMAQQAPQLLQAFTMMGLAIKTLLMYVLPFAALGAAVFVVWNHFRKLASEAKNLKELTDITTSSFSEQLKVIRAGFSAQMAQVDWLRKQADAQDDLRTATNSALAALREKAQLEQQLASAGGASRSKLAQMEIEAMRAEVRLLEEAQAKALAAKEKSRAEARLAADEQDEFNFLGEAQTLANLQRQIEVATKVADAAKEAMKNATVGSSIGGSFSPGEIPSGKSELRKATADDMISFVADGKEYRMSLIQAQAAQAQLISGASELETLQRNINNTLKDKNKLSEEDQKFYDQNVEQLNALKQSLGLKEEYLPRIAAASGGAAAQAGDALTSVGNFLGSGSGMINNIAQQQLDEVKMTNRHLDGHGKKLDRIAEKLTTGSGSTIEVPGS